MLLRNGWRLYEPSDLDSVPADTTDRSVAAMRTTMEWVEQYLCRPHRDLGRPGSVCPWTRPSLDRGLLWQAVVEGALEDPSPVERTLGAYRDWLLDLEPTDLDGRRFKTILVLFPDIEPERAHELIDGVQSRLKPSFVAEGMMIGQFHAQCPEPGLRNPEFRPLRSPIPLLAMRFMVETDRPFLTHSPEMLGVWRSLFETERVVCPARH